VGHVVTRWVSKRRGLALGVVYVGANIGAMIVVPLIAQITASSGWRNAVLWVGIGVASLILPFAIAAIRDPRPGELSQEGRVDLEQDPSFEGPSMDLGRAIKTRSFWLLGFNLTATFIYLVAMTDQLVPFLTDEGFSGSEAAGHFRTIVAMGLGSKIALGLLADRVTAPTALRFNTALLFVSSIVLLFLPVRGPLTLFIITYGFSSTARDVLYPLIVVHCFGVRHMAEIYGVLLLSLIAGALGPIVAAASRDTTGSYAGAFAGIVVLNGLSLVAAWLIRAECVPTTGDSGE
jgi:predicted MFS family arabinose efflux permease